jgi:hypothetical protein
MRSSSAPWLLLLPTTVSSHGHLIFPPSRNSEDRHLPAFAGGGYPLVKPFESYGCNCGDPDGCASGLGTRSSGNGQGCFWFSQGCTIGCSVCDNATQHTHGKATCRTPMEPILNDPSARTVNREAVAGSVNDSYRYNPWRAPGYAPVNDACGMAGGGPKAGPGEGHFYTVPWAEQGDLGSRVLPKSAPGTVWTAGSMVEVGWGIRYNHGGGYQYRLCPSSEPLTEECFARHPLPFYGYGDHSAPPYQQAIRWTDGSEEWINATLVWVPPPHHAASGENPVGYAWAMNPIPRIHFDSNSSGQPAGWSGCKTPAIGARCRAFDPPCKGDTGWKPVNGTHVNPVDVEGKCSGDATSVTIVDRLQIPAELPAGSYTLGWRWDCEETAQVWSSCADVVIDTPPKQGGGA